MPPTNNNNLTKINDFIMYADLFIIFLVRTSHLINLCKLCLKKIIKKMN